MGRMTLITGGERRRRWSQEDRARILAGIAEPGAVVADVARREDVCTSLVFKWPAETMSRGTPARDAAFGVVEVELRGMRVKIAAAAPVAVIAATLKALRS